MLSMPRFSIPELKVNRKYADLLLEAANSSEREKKEAAAFVKKKLDSAKWFVEAIKQRHNTLSNTMQAIIDYQRDYFIDGDETQAGICSPRRLRPLPFRRKLLSKDI